MTVFAVGIAGYAAVVLVRPGFGPPFVGDHRAAIPLALYAHLAGGAVALFAGPWQFVATLRDRVPRVHRWTGRVYVTSVALGGGGGIALATRSQHGWVTHLGFGALGVLWLVFTGMAYSKIRRRRIAEHQRWMMRSFALTLAAVALRIYLPISQVAGIPFPAAYQVVSWLCWVPNLLVAEWLVRTRVTVG